MCRSQDSIFLVETLNNMGTRVKTGNFLSSPLQTFPRDNLCQRRRLSPLNFFPETHIHEFTCTHTGSVHINACIMLSRCTASCILHLICFDDLFQELHIDLSQFKKMFCRVLHNINELNSSPTAEKIKLKQLNHKAPSQCP